MIVKINLKQIGERRQRIAPIDFEYTPVPRTLQELITQTVAVCVKEFNQRVREGTGSARPISKAESEAMAQLGKIAFGISYGNREQDIDQAVAFALQSFEDGLYRVFLNDTELEELSGELHWGENDSLTFIRLTMLAGRMW